MEIVFSIQNTGIDTVISKRPRNSFSQTIPAVGCNIRQYSKLLSAYAGIEEQNRSPLQKFYYQGIFLNSFSGITKIGHEFKFFNILSFQKAKKCRKCQHFEERHFEILKNKIQNISEKQ